MKYNKDTQRVELEQEDISDEYVINVLNAFKAVDFDVSIFLLDEKSKELTRAEEKRTGEDISLWTVLRIATQFIANEYRAADWIFGSDENRTDREH